MLSLEQIYKKVVEDAGGDAGAIVGGDAGTTSVSVGEIVSDIVGDIEVDDDSSDGIDYSSVLGTWKNGDGFMSKKNNMIPGRVKTPLKRFEIANGGSIKKKKTPYEKNMKIITASKKK